MQCMSIDTIILQHYSRHYCHTDIGCFSRISGIEIDELLAQIFDIQVDSFETIMIGIKD